MSDPLQERPCREGASVGVPMDRQTRRRERCRRWTRAPHPVDRQRSSSSGLRHWHSGNPCVVQVAGSAPERLARVVGEAAVRVWQSISDRGGRLLDASIQRRLDHRVARAPVISAHRGPALNAPTPLTGCPEVLGVGQSVEIGLDDRPGFSIQTFDDREHPALLRAPALHGRFPSPLRPIVVVWLHPCTRRGAHAASRGGRSGYGPCRAGSEASTPGRWW